MCLSFSVWRDLTLTSSATSTWSAWNTFPSEQSSHWLANQMKLLYVPHILAIQISIKIANRNPTRTLFMWLTANESSSCFTWHQLLWAIQSFGSKLEVGQINIQPVGTWNIVGWISIHVVMIQLENPFETSWDLGGLRIKLGWLPKAVGTWVSSKHCLDWFEVLKTVSHGLYHKVIIGSMCSYRQANKCVNDCGVV